MEKDILTLMAEQARTPDPLTVAAEQDPSLNALLRDAASCALFDATSVDGGWYRVYLDRADAGLRARLEQAGITDRMWGTVRGGRFLPHDLKFRSAVIPEQE